MWFRTNPPARNKGMLLRLLGGLLLGGLLSATASAETYEYTLTRPQWPQHANGHNIAAVPMVAEALRRFKENDNITIVIRYPGGDPGHQWANQLHGWLVSFGVPTRYLKLEPGSGGLDRLVVEVVDRS